MEPHAGLRMWKNFGTEHKLQQLHFLQNVSGRRSELHLNIILRTRSCKTGHSSAWAVSLKIILKGEREGGGWEEDGRRMEGEQRAGSVVQSDQTVGFHLSSSSSSSSSSVLLFFFISVSSHTQVFSPTCCAGRKVESRDNGSTSPPPHVSWTLSSRGISEGRKGCIFTIFPPPSLLNSAPGQE